MSRRKVGAWAVCGPGGVSLAFTSEGYARERTRRTLAVKPDCGAYVAHLVEHNPRAAALIRAALKFDYSAKSIARLTEAAAAYRRGSK